MDIIEILKIIILGIIEGITEWLPISSTGHLILADEFIKLNQSDEFKEMFMVVIQLGAILAVVLVYWKKIFPFSFKDKNHFVKMDKIILWCKIVVASIPAALCVLIDDEIDRLFYNYKTVAIMLIVYGILFIIVENVKKDSKPKVTKLSELTYKTAILIGVCQALAVIPGTSRSGATIIGALLLGTSRYVATEFTFFLAIPAMFGASFIKVLKFGINFTNTELITLIVGMAVAFVVSIFAIKFLVGYIKKNDFKVFGYYRIILGIIVLGYFMFFNK